MRFPVQTSFLLLFFFSACLDRNASGGRHSTVEVAFEVLVGGESGNTFDPEECEEFAEQCKVHAAHLAEEERRWVLRPGVHPLERGRRRSALPLSCPALMRIGKFIGAVWPTHA